MRGRVVRTARRLRFGAALAVALLLGACATSPRHVTVPAGCALDYSGRISVVDQGPQPHNLYGSFELRLDGDSGQLELGSPLGQMLARASWDADSARVDDGHATRRYDSFEDMTQATLGLRLPRAALRDWVRGLPAAQLPWRALSAGGFEQLGWQVRLQMLDGAPHILRLRREQDASAELLSLVIDHRAAQAANCAAPASPAAGKVAP